MSSERPANALPGFDPQQCMCEPDNTCVHCISYRDWSRGPTPLELGLIPKVFNPPRFQRGDKVHLIIKRPGQPRFPGYIVGEYRPLGGRHEGWVVEHERDGIIHVYPDAALAPGWE